MHYDTTLKSLISAGTPALIRMLTGARLNQLETPEFPATRNRRPDLVARLDDGRILHLELQTQADPRMAWRMLEYYSLIAERHGDQEIQQIVLALTPSAGNVPNTIVHRRLRYDYDQENLSACDPAPLMDSDHIEDVLFAVLCRSDDIGQRIRDIIARLTGLSAHRTRDAAVQLVILSGLRRAEHLTLRELTAMGVEIDIRENTVLYPLFEKAVQESAAEAIAEGRAQAMAEGRAQGMEKGMEKGMAEGMAEGMAQGMAQGMENGLEKGRIVGQSELVLDLMTDRYGPLPAPVVDRVRQADAAHLRLWARSLSRCDSVESLLALTPH